MFTQIKTNNFWLQIKSFIVYSIITRKLQTSFITTNIFTIQNIIDNNFISNTYTPIFIKNGVGLKTIGAPRKFHTSALINTISSKNIVNYPKFNIKYYNLSKYKYPIGSKLINLINLFYLDLLDDTKYLLILKIKLSNGKWVSLHKTVMITKDTMEEYINFVEWLLHLKYELCPTEGDESKYRTIAFEYIQYNINHSTSTNVTPISTSTNVTPISIFSEDNNLKELSSDSINNQSEDSKNNESNTPSSADQSYRDDKRETIGILRKDIPISQVGNTSISPVNTKNVLNTLNNIVNKRQYHTSSILEVGRINKTKYSWLDSSNSLYLKILLEEVNDRFVLFQLRKFCKFISNNLVNRYNSSLLSINLPLSTERFSNRENEFLFDIFNVNIEIKSIFDKYNIYTGGAPELLSIRINRILHDPIIMNNQVIYNRFTDVLIKLVDYAEEQRLYEEANFDGDYMFPFFSSEGEMYRGLLYFPLYYTDKGGYLYNIFNYLLLITLLINSYLIEIFPSVGLNEIINMSITPFIFNLFQSSIRTANKENITNYSKDKITDIINGELYTDIEYLNEILELDSNSLKEILDIVIRDRYDFNNKSNKVIYEIKKRILLNEQIEILKSYDINIALLKENSYLETLVNRNNIVTILSELYYNPIFSSYQRDIQAAFFYIIYRLYSSSEDKDISYLFINKSKEELVNFQNILNNSLSTINKNYSDISQIITTIQNIMNHTPTGGVEKNNESNTPYPTAICSNLRTGWVLLQNNLKWLGSPSVRRVRKYHSSVRQIPNQITSNYIQPAPTLILNKEFHRKSGLKNLIIKYYDILKYKSLENIIRTFFIDELDDYNRYFILLKVRLGDYSWRTLHHGIITSRSYLPNYLEFIKSQINILSEEYKEEENYKLIAFQYFVIPKNRWSQFPEGKWMHIQRKPSTNININDFHNQYNIPLNINYETWGDVTFKSAEVLIIEGKTSGYYTINFNNELNINTIIIGNIKFIDHKINNQYFKRTFKDFTYYIDNIEEKIVFSLNKINTNFLTKTNANPYNLKPEQLEEKICKN